MRNMRMLPRTEHSHERHSMMAPQIDRTTMITINRDKMNSMHGSLESSIESIDVDKHDHRSKPINQSSICLGKSIHRLGSKFRIDSGSRAIVIATRVISL